jgi:hypothetical protein
MAGDNVDQYPRRLDQIGIGWYGHTLIGNRWRVEFHLGLFDTWAVKSTSINQELGHTLSNHHLPAWIHWSAPMVAQGCRTSAFFIKAALKEALNVTLSTTETDGDTEDWFFEFWEEAWI